MKKRLLWLIPLALVLVCLTTACQKPQADGVHWRGEDLQIKLQGPCYIYNIQDDTFEENSTLTVDAYWKGRSSMGTVAVAAYPLPEWKIADPQNPKSEFTRKNWWPIILGDEPEEQVLFAQYYFAIHKGEQDKVGFAPVLYRLVQYRQESGTAVQIACYKEDGSCEKMLVALYGFSSQEEARQFAINHKETLTQDPSSNHLEGE